MKKKLREKIATFALVAVIGVTGVVNYVAASDDNIPYEFQLKEKCGNSYTDIEYRQTKNVNNKWKVEMVYSSEGKGTKATYWLNKPFLFSINDRVSDKHTIKQGSGAHYYKAYSAASEEWVNLAVENNNHVTKTYIVAGYWDEETN